MDRTKKCPQEGPPVEPCRPPRRPTCLVVLGLGQGSSDVPDGPGGREVLLFPRRDLCREGEGLDLPVSVQGPHPRYSPSSPSLEGPVVQDPVPPLVRRGTTVVHTTTRVAAPDQPPETTPHPLSPGSVSTRGLVSDEVLLIPRHSH